MSITVVQFVLKHHRDLTTLKCMVDSTVVRFVLNQHPDLTILKCMDSKYSCPICFEAPSRVDNSEVHVHYCCPICFEAPSGFDILRYFTIIPVSCVRFLIHFRFRENFPKFFFAKSEDKFSRKYENENVRFNPNLKALMNLSHKFFLKCYENFRAFEKVVIK
jgi:hypothetical protein